MPDPGPYTLRHSEKYVARERARFIAFGVGANPMMAEIHRAQCRIVQNAPNDSPSGIVSVHPHDEASDSRLTASTCG